MRLSGPAKLLRIHIGESDRYEGRPLHLALMELFQAKGIAGTTVLRGVEGFGAHAVVHAARILEFSADLPMVVEAIDVEDRIRGVLPQVRVMAREGLITLETVEVIGPDPEC